MSQIFPKWNDLQYIAIFLPPILGIFSGILSQYSTNNLKNAGNNINATPQPYVFGITWFLLYILFGVALALTISYWKSFPQQERSELDNWVSNNDMYIITLFFYILTFVLLFLWPFIFNNSFNIFNVNYYKKYALYLLLLILISTLICFAISPITAEIALSPLLGWEIFALLLNFTVVNQ